MMRKFLYEEYKKHLENFDPKNMDGELFAPAAIHIYNRHPIFNAVEKGGRKNYIGKDIIHEIHLRNAGHFTTLQHLNIADVLYDDKTQTFIKPQTEEEKIIVLEKVLETSKRGLEDGKTLYPIQYTMTVKDVLKKYGFNEIEAERLTNDFSNYLRGTEKNRQECKKRFVELAGKILPIAKSGKKYGDDFKKEEGELAKLGYKNSGQKEHIKDFIADNNINEDQQKEIHNKMIKGVAAGIKIEAVSKCFGDLKDKDFKKYKGDHGFYELYDFGLNVNLADNYFVKNAQKFNISKEKIDNGFMSRTNGITEKEIIERHNEIQNGIFKDRNIEVEEEPKKTNRR